MRQLSRSLLLVAGVLWAAAPDRARAQAAAGDAPRDAQTRFERERIRWLPVGGRGGGSCDQSLGRMCWTDESASDWYPTPEDPSIGAARLRLLDELAEAAVRAPDDLWVLEQRVFYLGEAGRWDEALALAAACDVGACRALAGLSLHALGRYVEAEEAFRGAIADMDPQSAARWWDPEWLLDDRGRGWWSDLDEDERARRAPSVWALADPLAIVPGNDLLTEHWARRTTARTREDARNPYGMRWGADLEELHIRYGAEIGWERQEGSPYDTPGPGQVVGHHHPESRPLFPPGAVLADPAAAPEAAWIPDPREARSEYAPGYAPILLPGAGQIAVFPRGDRLAVVGAYALPDDTTYHAAHDHPARDSVPAPWRGRPDEAGLFLLPADGFSDEVPGSRASGRTTGGLLLEAPAGRWVASLEVLSPAHRRAGRTRLGIDRPPLPPDVLSLSDLLLVSEALAPESSLDEAAARALPRTWVRAGERIGVVWELFGLGYRDERLSYRLTFAAEGEGILRRTIRLLRLGRAQRDQALEWEEQSPARPGPALRSVEVALPSLPEGRYRLRLEILTRGRPPLVRDLAIDLR